MSSEHAETLFQSDREQVGAFPLDDDGTWEKLERYLDPKETPAGRLILKRLREAGAIFVLIEQDYVDRDFSADYSAFWSRTFYNHGRKTRRLHFFSVRLDGITEADSVAAADQLEEASQAGSYLGFVVQRPVRDAPIARAALKPHFGTAFGPSALTAPRLEVRSDFEAHLLGATLKVRTVPFSQQDRLLSSCAQVAVWTCARHLHNRHGAPWQSMPEINSIAMQSLDGVSAESLPTGSGGLDLNGVLRALRALGQQPLAYMRSRHSSENPVMRSASVIARYVDSGIPVIVLLDGKHQRGRELHAVVAVGMAQKWDRPTSTARGDFTIGDYVEKFIVHDDVAGPFVSLPIKSASGENYCVETSVHSIVVPIPPNIVIPAEVAELVSRDRLRTYLRQWPSMRDEFEPDMGSASVELGDRVLAQADRLIARTYLTLGWKYKRRFARSEATEQLRTSIVKTRLPKMLWVTEFLEPTDQQATRQEHRVVAHCALDATNADTGRPPLVFHAPGFAAYWEPAPDNDGFGEAKHESEADMRFLRDDRSYPAKVRVR